MFEAPFYSEKWLKRLVGKSIQDFVSSKSVDMIQIRECVNKQCFFQLKNLF